MAERLRFFVTFVTALVSSLTLVLRRDATMTRNHHTLPTHISSKTLRYVEKDYLTCKMKTSSLLEVNSWDYIILDSIY